MAQIHHLGACLFHDLEDLIALRRRQIQLMLHPLDERLVRNPQPSMAIGETACSEPDRQARDRNRHEEPALAPIRQDRCSPRASRASAARGNPCPAVRPFQKSNPNLSGPRRRTGMARPSRSRRAALPPPPPTIPP